MVRKSHINITNQPCNSKLVPNIQTCQLCYDEFFKNIWQIWTIFCTTESIHCHPFNFWISFQFAHRIYQGQKSSFGAKSGAHSKTWELETKGMSYLVVTQYCKTIIRPILSFQKGQQIVIYSWSTICPSSLTRPSCLLSRTICHHTLAPSVGQTLNLSQTNGHCQCKKNFSLG